MLNILITGSEGQLGNEIRDLSGNYSQYHFIFTDVAELDITDSDKIELFFSQNKIDAVINCAAYTAVDRAEDEPEKAMLINCDAVEILAKACNRHGAHLVHVSTDYVFDGKGNTPYNEEHKTNPTSSYGRSKLAGEEAMKKQMVTGMIIRTSWLYSAYGANFVKTILKKGAELGKLNVVDDQIGCPTYAHDLAAVILNILPKAINNKSLEVYHYSNEGDCNWHQFAKAAIEMAGISCQVNPIASEQYPQKAPRPQYSVMDKTKIKAHFGISIPGWKESLAVCIERLKIEN